MPDNSGSRWSREDLILAFNLYCRTRFGRIHVRNPDIIELASLLERTPGAVSYKLANLARLDPALQARGIRGAPHGARADVAIWEEFSGDGEKLAFESEQLLAERMGRDIETTIEVSDIASIRGREREAVVRTRVNQSYFRRMILARYQSTCCITGLTIPELLVASHIIPWATATTERMNPRNGLCLNALHDRAFDRGLLTVTDDLRVRVASAIKTSTSPATLDLLRRFDGSELRLPAQFTPDREFLDFHRQNVFRG